MGAAGGGGRGGQRGRGTGPKEGRARSAAREIVYGALSDRRESREIEFVRTYDTQERERVRRASETGNGGGQNREKKGHERRETRRVREPGETEGEGVRERCIRAIARTRSALL